MFVEPVGKWSDQENGEEIGQPDGSEEETEGYAAEVWINGLDNHCAIVLHADACES